MENWVSSSYPKNTGIFFAGSCIYTEPTEVFPNDLRMTIPSSPLVGKITTNMPTSESLEPRNMQPHIEKMELTLQMELKLLIS